MPIYVHVVFPMMTNVFLYSWVYVLEKASNLEIPEQVLPQLPDSSEIRLVRTRSRSLNCLLDDTQQGMDNSL